MVYIVGLGPGSKEYMLFKAISILETSEVIIGFKRALESIEFINIEKNEVKNLKDILEFINSNEDKKISILASGDPVFYGIADYIKRNYNGAIEVIPGISSFQYLMAKLNKSWQHSYFGSVHGREEEFCEKIKTNKVSVWLTDKINSPKAICKRLCEEEISAKVYIGENLSYEDEKISYGTPKELVDKEFSNLSVVVIENEVL